MNATRQDAWTDDEDIILAETVLRYIREGKTQLEAFKDVAKQLSRTSAACGFRWNASIRKKYQDAIQQAKEERKFGGGLSQRSHITGESDGNPSPSSEKDTIETAISLLEKMRSTYSIEEHQKEQERLVAQLKEENELLKERLSYYEKAWEEMGNLWKWVSEKNISHSK
ncbi:RsfA family transcriptional regulator [Ornithinibacillus halophilus]|uniref:Transcription factor, RsfA family n=1 Tax=Ornithinibacillus halophilus TaxID=930117 RepID=A0A1M5C360_9BACI|nr:RsfA family transcriptional regulator [Ornithinibacillus halophilus]SHF49224.1 transcription factor, RsfA family [Ornithinibacillus halophilus]